MAQGKPHYKLTYFDIKGLGEPIRLLFAYVGQPYEDVRVTIEHWPKVKPNMPFGQVPLLEVDGKQLTQSACIMRYLGEQFGLMPKTQWDKAKADELVTAYFDFTPKLIQVFNTKDKDRQKQLMKEAISNILEPRLKKYDEYLSQSKCGYFGNDQICWADFFVYSLLDLCKTWMKINLCPYKHLTQFMTKFEALPQIKQWHEKHPDAKPTMFPFPGVD